MSTTFCSGNVFAQDAPPHHFRSWLVGPLKQWLQSKPDDDPARQVVERHSLLDVTGIALEECEMKVAREHTGKKGPATADSGKSPFFITVGVVLSGCMKIELSNLSNHETKLFVLGPGEYLVWRGSAHTHSWECVSEATVVTLRWSEDSRVAGASESNTPVS